MLVLSRKTGESLYINKNIKIIILSITNKQIRIGIEAPNDVEIEREELIKNLEQVNQKSLIIDTKK